MEFFGWFFGFLHFHRRILIGAILSGALVYWLLYGKDIMPKFARNNPVRPEVILTDPDPHDEDAVELPDNPESDTTTDAEVTSKNSGPVASDASVDELISQSLRISTRWPNASFTEASIIVTKSNQIAQDLLSRDNLTERQRKFAEQNLIETVSILDAINVQGKLGLPDIRTQLIREVQPYLDVPDTEISSLANLALAVYPSYDFLVEPTEERLQLAEQSFLTYFDKCASTQASRKLAEMVVRLDRSSALPAQTHAFALRSLEKFRSITSKDGELTCRMLEEQIYFGRLDLPTIVDRMSRNADNIDAEVNQFGSALCEVPTARIEIYQYAMDVIREYIKLGKPERAVEFTRLLKEQVLPKVEDEEKKSSIIEALNEFKPYL